MNREGGLATILVVLLQAEPRAGLARQSLELSPLTAPERAVTALEAPRAADPAVDVQARFEAFQEEFAEEFGVDPPADAGSDLGARVGEAFARRWEGSRAFRWYTRMEGAYGRLEGLYQRLEKSTRWAAKDFAIDPDLEAAIDGKLRLHVERRIGTFDMGVDVDDAMAGNLGLRLGGMIGAYKISFDVDDVVDGGRVGFQLRRVTR